MMKRLTMLVLILFSSSVLAIAGCGDPPMGTVSSGTGSTVGTSGSDAALIDDIWSYDSAAQAWARLSPKGELPPAASHVVYDQDAGQAILFSHDLSHLWRYDYSRNAWTHIEAGGRIPSMRQAGKLIYCSADRQVLLVGGMAPDPSGSSERRVAFLNDTWSYDVSENLWSEVAPTGDSPELGPLTAMVYDSSRGRVVVFSGQPDRESTVTNDTWSYDPLQNSWTALGRPEGPLVILREYSAVYVPSVDRVLLFGGADLDDPGGASTADLWAYDPESNTWSELHPEGAMPAGRQLPVMVYDPWGDAVLLAGGIKQDGGTVSVLSDTWSYDPSANMWTELHPRGTMQQPGWFDRAVFDIAAGRMLVIGQ